MRRRGLVAVAAAVVLAGCGAQKSGYTAVGDEEATTRPGVRNPTTIDMKGISFSPATVRVPAGATVTWVNRDKVAHTATQGTELYNDFNSGDVQPGRTYEKVLRRPQRIGYRCTIHPNMEGTIFVED